VKKLVIASSLIFLVGCSNGLDTSKLKEAQISKDGFIKFYDAPSIEVAIDALPYSVNLPERLPFKTKGFNALGITDIGGEGQNPEADFLATDEDENSLMLSTTSAEMDYPVTLPEEITLDNGYQAYYTAPNNLDVVVKDVTYSYTLNMNDLGEEQVKEELLELAEQLAE